MNKADRAEMEKLAEKFAEDVCECGCTNFVDSYKVGFQAGLEMEKARSAKLVENIKTALQFMSDSGYAQNYLSIEPEYQMYRTLEKALADYAKEGGGDE